MVTARLVSFYLFHCHEMGDFLHHAPHGGVVIVLHGLVHLFQPKGPEGAPLVLGVTNAALLESYFES